MKTLIVGCSFVDGLYLNNDTQYKINNDLYDIKGNPGSGNQAISARVLWECAQTSYEKVIVLWTGINRLDFPIGLALHQTMPVKNDKPLYPFLTVMGDLVWYHSGGFCSAEFNTDTPTWFLDWCRAQYKSSSPRYLTDLSLISILQAQSFLKSKKIPYQMAWIYSVDKVYSDIGWIDHVLGRIDKKSSFFNQIDWTTFVSYQPLFDYAREKQQLQDDKFHPTPACLLEWFQNAMDLDLTTH